MGFFGKLFGTEGSDGVGRTVEAGQKCAKCGQPISRENMAFDSGAGQPIHRICPEPSAQVPDQ